MRAHVLRTWSFKDSPINVGKGTNNFESEQGRSYVEHMSG